MKFAVLNGHPGAPTRTFENLKDSVMRQVAALPIRFETLVGVLDRPEWQVTAVVKALKNEDLLFEYRGFLKARANVARKNRR